jgi:hypothetical protein
MNVAKTAEKGPSQLITERIAELGGWRGKTLAHLRKLIQEAVPNVTEEWKWRGVPCWYHDGSGICTGESYKDHLKFTFFKGAELNDPKGVFTQDGTVRRAIDIYEGDKINDAAFKELVRQAVALNSSKKR